jgi:hypothetical protein
MFQASKPSKKLSHQQLVGQRGELQVADRAIAMGFAFQGFNRLETGVDGIMELRDPVTHSMSAKWIGTQVKTTEKGRYTAETPDGFEYLLDPADLAYWEGSNIPIVIVLVRIEDGSMFWKPVDCGRTGEPRRLVFDKAVDGFGPAAADAIAALTIERDRPGSYVPPMLSGEPLHLNLVRMVLPSTIFVAHSPFKSGREATKEMMAHKGQHHFDWVIRDRTFWSFRDPRGSAVTEIVDLDTLEEVETEAVAMLDDTDDENAFIDLLRRSVEAQLREDLAFHKDSRSLYFRSKGVGQLREYNYRSLQQAASADVVSVHEKTGRDMMMRHHAFSPRYQKIGGEWFVSISPTFVFTLDGHLPHPASHIMLTGKKKLERNGAIRGQVVMWRHLLVESGKPSTDLFTDQTTLDPRPKIRFEPLEPIMMNVTVPEDVWKRDDPHIGDLISSDTLL